MNAASPPPAFLIAAPRKSSGKTTISIGLTRAFTNLGLNVQTYKKGPDYIDPLWLARASRHPCFNLDFNTQSTAEIIATYGQNLQERDLAIVETNKGLFDGLDLLGADSNAQMAKTLKTPIILVIDAVGITRGIAPLVLGFSNFDPDIKISGIILNKVGGSRHESKLRNAIEHYTDIPLLGAVSAQDSLQISERHLGLTTPSEKFQYQHHQDTQTLIEKLATTMQNSVDLDAVLTLATSNIDSIPAASTLAQIHPTPDITIAVARDSAFGFYYADDLEAFQMLGAKLKFFSPLSDQVLPEADGLFIGGGFPETHMKALEKNTAMRAQILAAIQSGLPTYAECGGLMLLSNSIHWQGNSANMVGAIDGNCHMHTKPQGRGFSILHPTTNQLWNPGSAKTVATPIPAHEFHYANIQNLPESTRYAYTVKRGHGIDGQNDGIVINNLLANFCHLRNTAKTPWIKDFLGFVRKCKSERGLAQMA